MDIERYYQTQAFIVFVIGEDHFSSKIEYDRKDFERVVRLTEEISKGDEPTFHAIMETFVEVYPKIKAQQNLTNKEISHLSKFYKRVHDAKTALNRAEVIRLKFESRMLTDVSIETPNRTYKLYTDLSYAKDYGVNLDFIYIGFAGNALCKYKKLKDLYKIGTGIKSITKGEGDFSEAKEFLFETLEDTESHRIKSKNFNKITFDLLKTFRKVIIANKRGIRISKDEAHEYIKSVLCLDLDEHDLERLDH